MTYGVKLHESNQAEDTEGEPAVGVLEAVTEEESDRWQKE